jgi:putative drug exporter of the RND superfamily
VVFFAFTFTTDRTIKMIGLGMAAAVLTDALLVRTVLVPALMHTLGKANWRLPAVLDRRLPHLSLEDSDGPSDGADEAGLEDTGELRPVARI